jgi:hypothetical protein
LTIGLRSFAFGASGAENISTPTRLLNCCCSWFTKRIPMKNITIKWNTSEIKSAPEILLIRIAFTSKKNHMYYGGILAINVPISESPNISILTAHQ